MSLKVLQAGLPSIKKIITITTKKKSKQNRKDEKAKSIIIANAERFNLKVAYMSLKTQ